MFLVQICPGNKRLKHRISTLQIHNLMVQTLYVLTLQRFYAVKILKQNKNSGIDKKHDFF